MVGGGSNPFADHISVLWSFSGKPKSPGEEQDTRSFFHFSML